MNSVSLQDITLRIRGGSAGIRILYTHVTSSGDIRYDNRSYAVVVQRKSCARRQISAPSVPSCVHANDLSFALVILCGHISRTLQTVDVELVLLDTARTYKRLKSINPKEVYIHN